MTPVRTVCYLGMYASVFSRNKIYISGLRARGVTVIECRDDSPGWRKYVRLWQKHRALTTPYDVLVIGYLEHILVPFARLISSKPIVADMLGSLADAEQYSHQPSIWRIYKDRVIDWLAVTCADVVLLESEAQKAFFVGRFGALEKFKVLYTGVDEGVLYCPAGSRHEKKIVLFRGRITPEAGIVHVLHAAKLLEMRADIHFRIIGTHYRLAQPVKEMIRALRLNNVEFINEYLPEEVLREKMCEAQIMLGQFESNPRLDRTIPHKAFEAMYMGLPFITAQSSAVEELLTDAESCLYVRRADPADLAEKIVSLIDNPSRGDTVARAARAIYERRCSNTVLIDTLLGILSGLL